jgi:hypothetical protein
MSASRPVRLISLEVRLISAEHQRLKSLSLPDELITARLNSLQTIDYGMTVITPNNPSA